MSWQPTGPTRRKRGWIRVFIGLVLIAAGIISIVLGIVRIVGEVDKIQDDAVARGFLGEPVTFTAAQPDDYTIYVLSGPDVSGIACRVAPAGGQTTTLSGAGQDVEYTVGSASSIGRFETGPGEVEVRCEPGGPFEYIVTPGTPSIVRDILALLGGAFAIFIGIPLLIWGLIGRKVPA
jgi:hypothetical protein